MTTETQRTAHAAYMRKWKASHPRYYSTPKRLKRQRDRVREYRRKHPEKAVEYRLTHRLKTKTAIKRWQMNNRERCAENTRNWRAKNPQKAKAIALRSRTKHRDKILAKRREKRRLNINGYCEKNDMWRRNNRGRVTAARRMQYRKRRKNPAFRIESALRARIVALVRGKKSDRMIKLVGCSIDDLKIYLESKFEVGMAWENYGRGSGRWNIDHIIPCAIFDLTRPEHQRRCFHFSNLQPLWAPENIRKHSKVLTNQFQLL